MKMVIAFFIFVPIFAIFDSLSCHFVFSGMIKTPDEIQAYLNYINYLQLQPCKSPLGLLTTLDRDTWAQYRSQLIQVENNQFLSRF